MPSIDECDATTFDEGFATAAGSMIGPVVSRVPPTPLPFADEADASRLVHLGDVDIGGLMVPCYGLDAA